ncbi:MAG TPA: hypothetical protein VMD04_01445 [Candidatus Margulisiibacteriota bacterium]|nr:hypothetical protein [Candidatus Margulisiibacteriota bacterium]
MDKRDLKNLKKRYLLWLYKTTKEAFDKYERKFSQLEIDEFLLLEIEKELKDSYMPSEKKEMEKLVNDLRNYIDGKEKECFKLKYKGKRTNPEFIFLDVKLNAIEKAIEKELGKGSLEEIKDLYETEMVERILKSVEH